MRRIFILAAVVALCSSFGLADTVLQVNYWARFDATLPCTSNCTQDFFVTFRYDPTPYYLPGVTPETGPAIPGSILPGTLFIAAFGFMGSSFHDSLGRISTDGALYLVNGLGDDFDINVPFGPGINSMTSYLWGCVSSGCTGAIDLSWHGGDGKGLYMGPTYERSIVTVVPEPATYLMLAASLPIWWIKQRVYR